MKRYSFDLDDELAKKFDRICVELGRRKKEILPQIIREWLDKYERKTV
jgi:metal-responsive CopG/Arc/MetJ family transcriptional regulator